jgi:hypothetical protein
MQTRMDAGEGLSVLEQVLRDPREELHQRMANELWDSVDDADAVARLTQLATAMPPVQGELREVETAHG